MKLLLKVKGFFPFGGLVDIEPVIKGCRAEGSCLEPDDLLSVSLTTETADKAKRCVLSQREICPGLYDIVKKINPCKGLKESVNKAIHPNGAIKDSASHRLRKLRRRKTELRRGLQKRLENIKRSIDQASDRDDYLISLRDGRYVIPIQTEKKNIIQGIIHDYSRTQATCFFEPIEVVEDNNRLAEISHLEKEEESRVLAYLTAMIRGFSEDLLNTQAFLGKLDGLYARAQLSVKLNGVRPVISPDSIVDLRQAMNPILMCMALGGESTVPSDIFLDRDVNVMIISGPNRGGKTVTLKTLGLLSLMAQTGLHIPVEEGSRLPVFRHVLAEIGDDQDIEAGQSTFSAHVSHLRYMIENADQDSLILIDEPGMGTDPDEGVALAMALLDDLARKDSLVVVSTHFNRLKTYGLLEDRAKNACMEFDDTTNRPTFSLRYGTPGTSYAIEVARNHGIKQDLLDRAKAYLDQDEVHLNRLIDKLNRLKYKTELEKSEAENTKIKYHSARKKIVNTLRKVELDREEMLEKKRNEADLLIKVAKEEFKVLVNSLKGKRGPSQAFIQKRHDEITSRLTNDLYVPEDKGKHLEEKGLEAGQLVRHKELNLEGRLLSLDTFSSKATIIAGNVKLSVNTNDLIAIPEEAKPESGESQMDISHRFSGDFIREINLIGYRVEDALPLIDKIIDRSMIEGGMSLRIVHGHGTGKLKTAIRDHLSKYSCIKRIGGADPKSGGEAITVVEMN
ncbi:endonuclease MutS2 [Thermodesulfobacteriota bacterium]